MSSRAKKKWQHRQNGIHVEMKNEILSSRYFRDAKFAPVSPGEEKMSEVLLDFVAPYTATVSSEQDWRKTLQMGIVAWNFAMLPPDVRPEKLDSLIRETVKEGAAEFKEWILEMVERKARHFADCERWILSYRMTMTARGPSLSVLSSKN